MLEGVRCVVFDIDDTLYLERDYVRSGFRAVDVWVTETFSRKGFFDVAWRLFMEGKRGTVFNEALPAVGVEPKFEAVNEMVALYRGHQPAISLLPDAVRCLDRLRATGRALACLSDGPLASQQAKAAALGAGAWCDPIILTAAYGEGFGKPHPRGFVQISERVGVDAADCVYVADNPAKDFAGPKQLGWRTVRVRRAGSLHEIVPSKGDVDIEFKDLELLK